MFKNTFQSGFLSILYSVGSKPLLIWDKKARPRNLGRASCAAIGQRAARDHFLAHCFGRWPLVRAPAMQRVVGSFDSFLSCVWSASISYL